MNTTALHRICTVNGTKSPGQKQNKLHILYDEGLGDQFLTSAINNSVFFFLLNFKSEMKYYNYCLFSNDSQAILVENFFDCVRIIAFPLPSIPICQRIYSRLYASSSVDKEETITNCLNPEDLIAAEVS